MTKLKCSVKYHLLQSITSFNIKLDKRSL